jgi:hypothetical protein
MIRTVVHLLSAAMMLLAFLPSPATAQTLPVDDSASQVLGSTLRLRWDDPMPVNGRTATLSGTVTVLVRLDVRSWRGRTGRIYQVLPKQPATDVVATWTTQGPMLPGRLRDGERTLVFSGPIEVDELQDTFRLTIQANGDRMERTEQLKFSFEIELEQQ